MALKYLDKLTAAQQQDNPQQGQPTGRAAASSPSAGAALAGPAVLKPEFLIFRNITSAVVAQVSSNLLSLCGAQAHQPAACMHTP